LLPYQLWAVRVSCAYSRTLSDISLVFVAKHLETCVYVTIHSRYVIIQKVEQHLSRALPRAGGANVVSQSLIAAANTDGSSSQRHGAIVKQSPTSQNVGPSMLKGIDTSNLKVTNSRFRQSDFRKEWFIQRGQYIPNPRMVVQISSLSSTGCRTPPRTGGGL
jgi:hypothetical protein